MSLGNAFASAASATPSLGTAGLISSGLGAITSLAGGFLGSGASNAEARNIQDQGALEYLDAATAAEQRAREVRLLMGRQASLYTASGVTLEGTPLDVIENTRQLGQEEINALYRSGQARYQMRLEQAQQMRNNGRSSLIRGLSGGLGPLANMLGSSPLSSAGSTSNQASLSGRSLGGSNSSSSLYSAGRNFGSAFR